jgi:UDP-N-acetylmuramate--alanine ligase
MKHLHFMGIGGVGMSGLARWYRQDGYTISGCDSSPSSIVEALRAEHIPVAVGHHANHVQNGADTLISTMAVSDSHAEIQAAQTLGITHLKRIELLSRLFNQHQSIGITGTHGKSTTTGMVATIFVTSGLDPSVQIGAHLPLIEGNMRYSKSRNLVAEVDESDPGFAQLKSHIAVLTNLEDDHIAGDYNERRNYHASLEDLEKAAVTFAKGSQRLVYCADWERLKELVGNLEHSVSYGFDTHLNYQIKDVNLSENSSRFRLLVEGKALEVSLSVPGKHNVLNAAAALATAHLSHIDLDQAADALKHYTGVGRRWQRWGEVNKALIIDDYAHHPTEINATLSTAKHTGRRVRAVLQPHRWVRTARHWPAIADAAGLADEILVLDIYGAGEEAIPGISSHLIVNRLKAAGKDASHHTLSSAQEYLAETLAENDLVITLGAGDVWRVAAGLVNHA